MYCLINDGDGNEKNQVPYSLQIVFCFHSSPKCEPVSFFIAYVDLKMFKTEKFAKERSCTQCKLNCVLVEMIARYSIAFDFVIAKIKALSTQYFVSEKCRKFQSHDTHMTLSQISLSLAAIVDL